MIVYMQDCAQSPGLARDRGPRACTQIVCTLVLAAVLSALSVRAKTPPTEWQQQVRKYSQVKDWDSAMRILDQEIARSPQDMDVRAWRARVLEWSGNLAQAEQEVLQRSEEHTSELQSHLNLVCRLLLEKKNSDMSEMPGPAVASIARAPRKPAPTTRSIAT